MALVRWLRTAELGSSEVAPAPLSEAVFGVPVAVDVVPTAAVAWAPLIEPPVVLTHISFSVSGLSQYSGETSMTTWYWFSAL